MSNATVFSTSVNKIPRLFLHPSNGPCVRLPDETIVNLPDTPWGRWYARSHFTHMEADSDAAAWFDKENPLKFDAIPGLINPPRGDYQILAINRGKMSNCALFLDMGLGKTFVIIAIALWLLQKQQSKLFLVVCPPSVFTTWQDEVDLHIDKQINAKVVIAHGPKRNKILTQLVTQNTLNPTFILTSYETLESIREKLQTLPIALIAFDESSKLKHGEANRTQSAHALCKSLPNTQRYLLSGTPSTTNPLGFWSQYEILGPGWSGFTSYQAFAQHFSISKRFIVVRLPNGRVITVQDDKQEQWLHKNTLPDSDVSYAAAGFRFSRGFEPHTIHILGVHKRPVAFKNQEDLHRVTQAHAYTVKKETVLKDLPPKIYSRRDIEMSPEQKKAYADLLESGRTQIEQTHFSFSQSGSVYMKLHQIANGFILDAQKQPVFFKAQPKLAELKLLLEEAGDQKIVFWSPMIAQIDQVVAYLQKEKIPVLQLDGRTPIPERTALIHRFQDPKFNGPLVANPAVGGFGLNLTCATVEGFLTNWFMPEVRAQAEDRCHRIGQQNSVTVVDFITTGTLEAKLLRTTRKQISLENQIISMTALMGKET